jgi:hypothetical protein
MNRTKTTFIRAIVLGSGLFAAHLASPATALACGDAWGPDETDYRPMGIARAESELEKGNLGAAAGTVLRVMPHVRSLDPAKSILVARAQRVLAVATARTDGALPVAREVPDYAVGDFLGRTPIARASNLAWSVSVLRKVGELRDGDPAVRSELGEALSKLDATRDEAKGVLEDLAGRDLLTTPEGYATLALLRGTAGDTEGRETALRRCEAMANGRVTCGSPDVAKG